MEATAHLGRQRMEQATWQPVWTFRLPRLSRPARFALFGRVVAFMMVVALFGGLAIFARPEPGRSHDPGGAGFQWSGYDPATGRQVPRAEWVARALEEI